MPDEDVHIDIAIPKSILGNIPWKTIMGAIIVILGSGASGVTLNSFIAESPKVAAEAAVSPISESLVHANSEIDSLKKSVEETSLNQKEILKRLDTISSQIGYLMGRQDRQWPDVGAIP